MLESLAVGWHVGRLRMLSTIMVYMIVMGRLEAEV